MTFKDIDLKVIEGELRAPVVGDRRRRSRGGVSGAIEKLLPAIEARRAEGVTHTEIIEYLIDRKVVASAPAYWTALRIARRNFRERVQRNTPLFAGSAQAAPAPARAPTVPVKAEVQTVSPSPTGKGAERLRIVPVEAPAGVPGRWVRLEEVPGEPLAPNSPLQTEIGKVVELVEGSTNSNDGPIAVERIERRLADLVGHQLLEAVIAQAGSGTSSKPWEDPALSLKQKGDLLADRYMQPKSSASVRALADKIAIGGRDMKEGET